MARIRTIKPDFFLHEELAELSALHRLLFIGLWTLADKRGVLEDRPKRIKAALLPWEDCDVGALLADLERGGFIVRYEAEGERCIFVPGFTKHQKPHPKEADASLPLPGPDVFGREISRLAVERSDPAGKGFPTIPSSPAGKGREGVSFPSENGSGKEAEARPSPPAPKNPAFAWLAQADQLRAEAFPSALQDAPEGGRFMAWWKQATGQAPPDVLLTAYRGYLADPWASGLSPPCPWSGWQSQWKRHVPGQHDTPVVAKPRSANGF